MLKVKFIIINKYHEIKRTSTIQIKLLKNIKNNNKNVEIIDLSKTS